MNKKTLAVKKNISSLQVLKTLEVLLDGNYTMKELIEKLNQNEPTKSFNNSVVSKYINSCRYCGIEILKNNNRYFLTRLPFGIDITQKNINSLQILHSEANKMLAGRSLKIFNNFMNKLKKYSNHDVIKTEALTTNIVLTAFEKAISDRRKVKIMFKTKAPLTGIPISTVIKDGKAYFYVIFNDREKLVAVENVFCIEILTERFIPVYTKNTVIFKIKGDLIKRYSLRENECIIDYDVPNSITIANRDEQKEILFSRLLRYDSLCEIISPKSYREEMKQIIDSMIANYEVKECF